MGATGNTGREITRLLLEHDRDVRALGPSRDRLVELEMAGAEVVAGDPPMPPI